MALQTPSRSDEERLISAFGALPQLAMTPDTVGSVTSFLTGDDRGQGPLLTSIAEAAQNGTLPPTRKVTSKSTFLAAMDETQNPMMAAMAAPLIADQSMPYLPSGLRPPQPDEMVGLSPLLSGIAPPSPEEEMMNLLAGQITLPPIYEGSGMPVIRRAPPPVATPIPAGIIDPFSNWV